MKAMRKTLALLLALVLMLAAIPVVGSAAEEDAAYPYGVSGDTVIDTEEYIPDGNFMFALMERMGLVVEDGLTAAEAAAIERLDLDGADIHDLTGIEFFTSLKVLKLDRNSLGENGIDLSNNLNLVELIVTNNQLSELDVSMLSDLEILNCRSNELTELDVSGNPNLRVLRLEGNWIESRDDITLPEGVDFADFEKYSDDHGGGVEYTFEEAVREDQGWDDGREITTAMKESVIALDVSGKYLTSLDGIEDYVNLEELDCGDNNLRSFDLSNNKELRHLECYNNMFGRNGVLDVSENTNLVHLTCERMGLSELDVSENTALEYLSCQSNGLTTLDISKNTKLTYLNCEKNNLTTLDISGLGDLEWVDVNGNYMTSEASVIGYNADITGLRFGEQREPNDSPVIEFADPRFEEVLLYEVWLEDSIKADGVITQAEAATVENLDIGEKGITSLEDIKYFTGLKYLNCAGNEFTTLDISQNKNLVNLDCKVRYTGEGDEQEIIGAKLTSLIVGETVFSAMEEIRVNDNNLTSLNITNMPKLRLLEGGGNVLESLDLSGNPELETLIIGSSEQLNRVDFSKNPKLKELYWIWGSPYELDVTKNPALEVLQIVGGRVKTIDLSNNKNLERLSCIVNHLTKLDVTGLNKLKSLEVANNYILSEDLITGLNKAQLDEYIFGDQYSDDLLEAAETDSLYRLRELMGLLEDSWPTTYEEHYEVGEFDPAIRAILDRIEANYKRLTGVTEDPPVVEPDVPDFVLENISKIKIVGTVFNADANGKVGLKLNKPSEQAIAAALAAIDSDTYDTSTMTQVEIELSGVETDSNGKLAHPVTLTMPIPEFLSALGLRILHYNDDGITYEVIIPTINGDQTCSFTVDHFSLFAFVEAIDPANPPVKPVTPVTPPATTTTTSSDSGSGGSGGGGSAATTSTAPAPVSKTDAVNLTKTAITNAAKAGTSAVVKLKNVSTLSLANIKAMITAAGKTAFTIQADSLSKNGKAVDVRIALDPAKSTKDLSLSASTWNASAVNTKSFFKSFYSNALMAVSFGQQGTFGQPVKLAVKLDANLKKDALVFYSYDKAANTYKQIPNPNYVVDANGYVHFTTELAGDIIISDGALAKK